MAYTINLYPSSDISGNNRHSASNGSTLFSMINETEDDSGTTYIYSTLSNNQTVTNSSSFNCSANTNEKPSGKIKVRNITVNTFWLLDTTTRNMTISSRTATLTPSVSFENGEYINGTSATRTTDDDTNYTEFNSIFSNLSIIDKTFNSIDDLNAKLQIYTSGRYSATSNN